MLALKKIGYSATLALIEALNSKDKLMRQNSAIVLGNIKDTRAIAALKKILEDPNEDPQVKRYAKEAVLKITNEDPGKWKKAVDCYYDLAEKYYYSHPSVIPAWETAFLFWKWDEQRDILTEREVPSFAYNEQLAEEALFDLFKLDPSYKKGWKLLLMTYLAQYEEARIALEGSERSLAIGTLSEKELELLKRKLSNFERLKVLAGMIGKEAIYQALEETLGDNQAPKQKLRRNPLVARGCIKLLEELGDKNDLPPEKLDKEKDRRKYIGYPLVKALTDPDKRVRYAAAGCILKLSPREKRLGWQLVIPNLVDAIQETGVRVALIIYEVKDQKDYDVVNKLRKKLIMLGVFPVVASSAEEGLIRSRAFPGQDLILIQYKVASRVRIRETVNNKELVRENVFDAIRDDIRTKHIPKFMICDTDEELRNAKNVFLAHVKCFIKSDIEKLELRKHLEDLFAEGRAKEDAKARADMLAKEAAIALTTINPNTSAYPYKDTVASLIKASSPEILRKDSIRLPSIRALGNMRDKRAIPVLLRILDDKASDPAKVSRQKPIRLAAAQALSKIFKKNGYKLSKVEFALLRKYLYDGDLEIEFAVAKALANSALTDKERLELEEFRRLKRKAYTADE
jgi:HEAT repeat protein